MDAFVYSVVIPHYNSSLTLKRLLESIPERDDIQIVVADDFSNDKERKALKEIRRKNLEFVFSAEKNGAGYVRNEGLKLARGRWVLFADADDFYNDGAFIVLDQYKNSAFDYICFCANSYNNEKKQYGGRKITSDASVRSYLKERSAFNMNLFKFKNFACWNKMYAKEFLKKNRIMFENSLVNNDVWFAFQVALHAKTFDVIPNELYCCTYSSNSLTYQKRSIEREFEFYKMAKKRNGFYKALHLSKGFVRYDCIYLPYIIKKRGLMDALRFYRYVWKHKKDLEMAEKEYPSMLMKISGACK